MVAAELTPVSHVLGDWHPVSICAVTTARRMSCFIAEMIEKEKEQKKFNLCP
jgi:hypothetical protein